MLWERLEEWRWNRPANAMQHALACYDFDNDPDAALEAMTDNELNTAMLHEIGEVQAGKLLGGIGNADKPMRADTLSPQGARLRYAEGSKAFETVPPNRETLGWVMRRAYRDRAEYLGDPDFVEMPVARLLDPMYAAGLVRDIRLDRASPSQPFECEPVDVAEGRQTTHFSIMDRAGNRVAATLSINYPFGSGFVPPGTGVLLNDEMDDFSAKPGVPNVYGLVGGEANAIAPGKRMLSSMSPSIVARDGELVAVVGSPDDVRTEIVKAFVVPKENVKPGPDVVEDIKTFVKKRLAAHEYPREVEFVNELPLTATGKIMRRELKKMEIQRKLKS